MHAKKSWRAGNKCCHEKTNVRIDENGEYDRKEWEQVRAFRGHFQPDLQGSCSFASGQRAYVSMQLGAPGWLVLPVSMSPGAVCGQRA